MCRFLIFFLPRNLLEAQSSQLFEMMQKSALRADFFNCFFSNLFAFFFWMGFFRFLFSRSSLMPCSHTLSTRLIVLVLIDAFGRRTSHQMEKWASRIQITGERIRFASKGLGLMRFKLFFFIYLKMIYQHNILNIQKRISKYTKFVYLKLTLLK